MSTANGGRDGDKPDDGSDIGKNRPTPAPPSAASGGASFRSRKLAVAVDNSDSRPVMSGTSLGTPGRLRPVRVSPRAMQRAQEYRQQRAQQAKISATRQQTAQPAELLRHISQQYSDVIAATPLQPINFDEVYSDLPQPQLERKSTMQSAASSADTLVLDVNEIPRQLSGENATRPAASIEEKAMTEMVDDNTAHELARPVSVGAWGGVAEIPPFDTATEAQSKAEPPAAPVVEAIPIIEKRQSWKPKLSSTSLLPQTAKRSTTESEKQQRTSRGSSKHPFREADGSKVAHSSTGRYQQPLEAPETTSSPSKRSSQRRSTRELPSPAVKSTELLGDEAPLSERLAFGPPNPPADQTNDLTAPLPDTAPAVVPPIREEDQPAPSTLADERTTASLPFKEEDELSGARAAWISSPQARETELAKKVESEAVEGQSDVGEVKSDTAAVVEEQSAPNARAEASPAMSLQLFDDMVSLPPGKIEAEQNVTPQMETVALETNMVDNSCVGSSSAFVASLDVPFETASLVGPIEQPLPDVAELREEQHQSSHEKIELDATETVTEPDMDRALPVCTTQEAAESHVDIPIEDMQVPAGEATSEDIVDVEPPALQDAPLRVQTLSDGEFDDFDKSSAVSFAEKPQVPTPVNAATDVPAVTPHLQMCATAIAGSEEDGTASESVALSGQQQTSIRDLIDDAATAMFSSELTESQQAIEQTSELAPTIALAPEHTAEPVSEGAAPEVEITPSSAFDNQTMMHTAPIAPSFNEANTPVAAQAIEPVDGHVEEVARKVAGSSAEGEVQWEDRLGPILEVDAQEPLPEAVASVVDTSSSTEMPSDSAIVENLQTKEVATVKQKADDNPLCAASPEMPLASTTEKLRRESTKSLFAVNAEKEVPVVEPAGAAQPFRTSGRDETMSCLGKMESMSDSFRPKSEPISTAAHSSKARSLQRYDSGRDQSVQQNSDNVSVKAAASTAGTLADGSEAAEADDQDRDGSRHRLSRSLSRRGDASRDTLEPNSGKEVEAAPVTIQRAPSSEASSQESGDRKRRGRTSEDQLRALLEGADAKLTPEKKQSDLSPSGKSPEKLVISVPLVTSRSIKSLDENDDEFGSEPSKQLDEVSKPNFPKLVLAVAAEQRATREEARGEVDDSDDEVDEEMQERSKRFAFLFSALDKWSSSVLPPSDGTQKEQPAGSKRELSASVPASPRKHHIHHHKRHKADGTVKSKSKPNSPRRRNASRRMTDPSGSHMVHLLWEQIAQQAAKKVEAETGTNPTAANSAAGDLAISLSSQPKILDNPVARQHRPAKSLNSLQLQLPTGLEGKHLEHKSPSPHISAGQFLQLPGQTVDTPTAGTTLSSPPSETGVGESTTPRSKKQTRRRPPHAHASVAVSSGKHIVLMRYVFQAWKDWAQNRNARRHANRVHKARVRMYRGSRIHNRMKHWYIQACFHDLERGEGLSYNASIKTMLERQIDSITTSLPSYLRNKLRMEALPVVQDMVQTYQKQLGARNAITKRAKQHFRDLCTQLGVPCETK